MLSESEGASATEDESKHPKDVSLAHADAGNFGQRTFPHVPAPDGRFTNFRLL